MTNALLEVAMYSSRVRNVRWSCFDALDNRDYLHPVTVIRIKPSKDVQFILILTPKHFPTPRIALSVRPSITEKYRIVADECTMQPLSLIHI